MDQDVIHRFSFANAPIRGQWVRLSGTLEEAFQRQRYPVAARRLLAEMLAAVSLMADNVKLPATVALQSRGNGPVSTALAECRDRHLLRGLVRWRDDAESLEESATEAGHLGSEPALSNLLGDGQMAITLTPVGRDGIAYQGVVSLADDSLTRNLEDYFVNSEQLPTRLFMAFDGDRVTGLLLQRLPIADLATELTLDISDAVWDEVELLAETVRPEELASLPLNTLLRRLFHQHTITVHPARSLEFACTCSRERVEQMLRALPKAEILDLLQTRGSVDVTCEVCGAEYRYDRFDTHVLYEPEAPRVH